MQYIRGFVRHLPAMLGITVILSGYAVVQATAGTADGEARVQLASARDRGADNTVSRGNPERGSSPLVSSELASDVRPEETISSVSLASSADLVSSTPSTEVNTSTTVVVTTIHPTTIRPTTTAAPTTVVTSTSTTVAPPVTTTTTSTVPTVASPPPAHDGANSQSGRASYYSHKPGGCAHKTLPMGTLVTVTNTANGKTATCFINDRGPFVAGRIIDLDITVFRQVASTSAGVFPAHMSW